MVRKVNDKWFYSFFCVTRNNNSRGTAFPHCVLSGRRWIQGNQERNYPLARKRGLYKSRHILRPPYFLSSHTAKQSREERERDSLCVEGLQRMEDSQRLPSGTPPHSPPLAGRGCSSSGVMHKQQQQQQPPQTPEGMSAAMQIYFHRFSPSGEDPLVQW